MQSVSSRTWTRVAVSISYDDNHYATGTSKRNFTSINEFQIMQGLHLWKIILKKYFALFFNPLTYWMTLVYTCVTMIVFVTMNFFIRAMHSGICSLCWTPWICASASWLKPRHGSMQDRELPMQQFSFFSPRQCCLRKAWEWIQTLISVVARIAVIRSKISDSDFSTEFTIIGILLDKEVFSRVSIHTHKN